MFLVLTTVDLLFSPPWIYYTSQNNWPLLLIFSEPKSSSQLYLLSHFWIFVFVLSVRYVIWFQIIYLQIKGEINSPVFQDKLYIFFYNILSYTGFQDNGLFYRYLLDVSFIPIQREVISSWRLLFVQGIYYMLLVV